MTSLIATPPPLTAASTSAVAARQNTLGAVVAAACDAVVSIPLDDPRWDTVGVRLTAVVDAVRRANGLPGSPIGSEETVAVVMRLRDLGRLAQALTPSATDAAPEEIEDLLWSLQVAAV